jgi:hypothetical protein
LREVGRVLGPVALGWIALVALALLTLLGVMSGNLLLSLVAGGAMGWVMLRLFGLGGGYNSP